MNKITSPNIEIQGWFIESSVTFHDHDKSEPSRLHTNLNVSRFLSNNNPKLIWNSKALRVGRGDGTIEGSFRMGKKVCNYERTHPVWHLGIMCHSIECNYLFVFV